MTSLSKICLHWTAGSNNPCDTDLNAYHYCIDSKGRIYVGKHKPEDNLNCNDGNYAAHCGGNNTGCIGVSLCGMKGFTETKKQTPCPINQKQVESMCALNGYLCNKYGISINKNTLFTHYEFDSKKQQPKGKIDIIYLPYLPDINKNEIGNYIRNKSQWYKNQIQEGKYQLEKKGNYYEINRLV